MRFNALMRSSYIIIGYGQWLWCVPEIELSNQIDKLTIIVCVPG
jgi:hypothetical protein